MLPITALGSGVTVNYDNGEAFRRSPRNVDLNNPRQLRLERRPREPAGRVPRDRDQGRALQLHLGRQDAQRQGGRARTTTSRARSAHDNSGAWQAATCGNNPSVFLLGPERRSPPATARTRRAPAPRRSIRATARATPRARHAVSLTYQGSLIPQQPRCRATSPRDPLASSRWTGTASPRDSHYEQFVSTAPAVGSSNTGASAGFVRGEGHGGLREVNGNSRGLARCRDQYNAGLRFVHTDQTVGGFVSIPDPRNAALNLANGGKYPNIDHVRVPDRRATTTRCRRPPPR